MTEKVSQALNPQQGAGLAPFSIERLGPEVERGVLEVVPGALTLKSDDRATVSWTSRGHIHSHNDLIISPAEGLARGEKHPEYVFPMRRFSDGTTERVRFGFRSATCRVPPKRFQMCEYGDEELFLVADMTCHEK